MLILYYWPGASSMVPHIVLEEIGTAYQRQLVNLALGEHKSDAYLKINPHGKVPALAVDNTVLTENVAILTYLARRFPEAHLLPEGAIEEARCLSTMAWFASAVHTTFRISSGLSGLLPIKPHTAILKRLLGTSFGTIAGR
jgi:glutathione S-transferase